MLLTKIDSTWSQNVTYGCISINENHILSHSIQPSLFGAHMLMWSCLVIHICLYARLLSLEVYGMLTLISCHPVFKFPFPFYPNTQHYLHALNEAYRTSCVGVIEAFKCKFLCSFVKQLASLNFFTLIICFTYG